MGTLRFDWRWIALIIFIALLANSRQIPWQIMALILAGGGGYLLAYGWRVWTRSGGTPTRSRVSYWRGQRYELGPPRRGPALPSWSGIGPAALYLLLGGVLLLAAITIVLRELGI